MVIPALLIAGQALAGDWAQAWGTGLNRPIPVHFSAGAAWHQAIGDTWTHTPELWLAAPLRRAPRFGGGLTFRLTGSGLVVPDEDRSRWTLGVLEGTGQVFFTGPAERDLHALGVQVGGTPSLATTYWRLPRETSIYAGLFYEGVVRPDPHLHLALRLDLAGNVDTRDVATASVTVLGLPHPAVALHVGAQLSATDVWFVVAGLRGRPVEGLELGATMTLPIFAPFGGLTPESSRVRPSFEITGWLPTVRPPGPDR